MHHGTGAKLAAFAALGLLAGVSGAAAQEVVGTWERDTGASRVRFTKCGEALCGSLSWLKDTSGPAKVGQRIFYDMKPNGANKWSGSAFNPEDGKTYSGTMTLSGNTLTTAGCVMGGLICRSVKWNRMN
ncbi:DUF2147 domain-containing protein [Bosea sp. ANAM02]|uniref:DUF2147 domain-containing protein n=1 Tax=Bosea sp. ANAM02 TaxID=2020412 RepID=UPI000647FE9E|nr:MULTISPECIES: DUF2147 domain-containing protein [Hyphomicrobiales]BCB19980.1 hypothetical protein OCUBac02_28740 [Bosea sp. ANAM02]